MEVPAACYVKFRDADRLLGIAISPRRSQLRTLGPLRGQRTGFECPSSVATHLPVATSHTLSVLSHDADTTRRPSGNTATP